MTLNLNVENVLIAVMIGYPLVVIAMMKLVGRDRLNAMGYFQTDYQGWGFALLATPFVWMLGFAGLYLNLKYGGAA